MNRPALTQEEELRMGWQQLTYHAAEYMNTAPQLWGSGTVEEVKSQARHLAAAQWMYHVRHINEWYGKPELR